jgi:hypothetical protein
MGQFFPFLGAMTIRGRDGQAIEHGSSGAVAGNRQYRQQFSESFCKAIEPLGRDKLEVQLGAKTPG